MRTQYQKWIIALAIIMAVLFAFVVWGQEDSQEKGEIEPESEGHLPGFAIHPLKKEFGKTNYSPSRIARAEKVLSDKAFENSKLGIMVISLSDEKEVFSYSPNDLLVPASTNKLFTACAALAILKPEYQFKTKVFVDRRPENGVVNGNFYVKGSGDPAITLEQLWKLAHEIRVLGVTHIKGDLVGDVSFFDDAITYSEWRHSGNNPFIARISAFAVNFNTVRVVALPASLPGKRAILMVEPESVKFNVDGDVNTTAPGTPNTWTVGFKGDTLLVRGSIPAGAKPFEEYYSVNDPASFSLGALFAYLKHEGIEIDGSIRIGAVPTKAYLLTTHESPYLAVILRDMMRFSNNFQAEMIFKTIGAEQLGEPGTRAKAASVIANFIEKNGINTPGCVIFDGSGLARENLQSARSMANLLAFSQLQPPFDVEFEGAMPIAGVDGTLKRRFSETGLMRRVRAKTGYLNGAVALAGYCYDQEGKKYAFAFLVNNPKASIHGIHKLTEKFLNALMNG